MWTESERKLFGCVQWGWSYVDFCMNHTVTRIFFEQKNSYFGMRCSTSMDTLDMAVDVYLWGWTYTVTRCHGIVELPTLKLLECWAGASRCCGESKVSSAGSRLLSIEDFQSSWKESTFCYKLLTFQRCRGKATIVIRSVCVDSWKGMVGGTQE